MYGANPYPLKYWIGDEQGIKSQICPTDCTGAGVHEIEGWCDMEIKDSGERRQFDTGAVRDIAEGKGRCDLLPLGIIGRMLNDDVLRNIELYIRSGNADFIWSAIIEFMAQNCKDIYTLLLEASKQYEGGAKKYGDRNWEKGIPVHCYIDSGVRHYLKWRRGDQDEPHDRAFVWNMLGAIWTHTNKPELIDLPFSEAQK